MKTTVVMLSCIVASLAMTACKNEDNRTQADMPSGTTGLRIAYVNGDSILMHFTEFRKESEAMEAKQRKAETELQAKGAALEKEIMAYQQKAQAGTLTGKEMQAREKYLATRQDAILTERDQMAKAILDETEQINRRLKEVLNQKLKAIQEEEGYDFILSYVEGGSILLASEKYDITDRVLKELNAEPSGRTSTDSTGPK